MISRTTHPPRRLSNGAEVSDIAFVFFHGAVETLDENIREQDPDAYTLSDAPPVMLAELHKHCTLDEMLALLVEHEAFFGQTLDPRAWRVYSTATKHFLRVLEPKHVAQLGPITRRLYDARISQ